MEEELSKDGKNSVNAIGKKGVMDFINRKSFDFIELKLPVKQMNELQKIMTIKDDSGQKEAPTLIIRNIEEIAVQIEPKKHRTQ